MVACSLSACASFGTFAGQDTGDVTFADSAEENMRKGDEAMANKNFQEASAYFEFVKTKYPYLEVAKTAELRLADADFERDRFAEARERYQNFVRLHPTDARIDYAAFRAALTHYKEIPSDFFLLPPASEKDQVEVRNAASALNEFVRSYPSSQHLEEARKAQEEVRVRLAEHELYVASFYARRDRWPAVVNRLNTVAREYGGVGAVDERVAFGLHDAYVAMKDPARAREALQKFVDQHPDDAAARRAQRLIAELPASATPAAPPDAGT